MKTALRWVVVGLVGAAAAGPYAAFAGSPASNGIGDGEANVPFASLTAGADEGGGGSAAPSDPREVAGRGKVAGRSGRAAGRPAYRAARADSADAPAQTEADREFLQRVWTAP